MSMPHRPGLRSTGLSRRTLLGATAAAAIGAGPLAACSTAASSKSSGKSGADSHLLFLEPGDPPARWTEVRDAVNKKLQKDTGLTFDVTWIGWSNYAQSELLKYTSGEKFTGSLEAGWLHINKLSEDKAIYDLDSELTKAKYPELVATLDPLTTKTSKINGKLYGVPQVNNASVMLGFMARSDLASGPLDSFDKFEKFLYDVKQRRSSVIPYGMDNGYVNDSQDLFNPVTWNLRAEHLVVVLSSGYPLLYIKTSDALAGNARVVPVWEVPDILDGFRRVRRYYNDGIINHDALSVDKNTVMGLFGQGKYAAGIGDTSGLMTASYGATMKNVPGAKLELCFPFGPQALKPFSAFGSGNQMALSVHNGQLSQGLAFQNWLSIKANHDLLEYGIEGTDWNPVGEDQFKALSRYSFPGYTMSWRVPLERTPSDMIESERKWFSWSQKFDSFELSPLAGYVTQQDPIKTQIAEIDAGNTKYLKPIQAGAVDTQKGLDAAKKGFSAAGLDKVIAEVERQLGEFFKGRG